MEDVPSYGFSKADQEAFDYFESKPEVEGSEEAEARIPCTWLPHAKYILDNEPFSSLLPCRTHPEGEYPEFWSDIGLWQC